MAWYGLQPEKRGRKLGFLEIKISPVKMALLVKKVFSWTAFMQLLYVHDGDDDDDE